MSNKVSAKELYARQLAKNKKESSLIKGPFFLVGVAVLLLFIAWVWLVFLPNQYRFSFNVDGLEYYSNEFTPNEFFSLARDNNVFVVSVDLVDGNSDPWVVNSMNLWLVALNADKKRTELVVKSIDSFGVIKSCITNDGNILEGRSISGEECSALLSNPLVMKINLHFSNDNKVILSMNQVDIYAQKGRIMSTVNYLVIKGIYQDFDKTLLIINEKIQSIK